MNEKVFKEELEKIGIILSEKELELFSKYSDFLLEYNKHTNLTAIRNKEDVYLKHFYDSLLLLKYFDIKGKKVLDIGSGAGFPGVPLKIVCPSIELVVLDSNGKKTTFLEKLKNELGIEYEVINARAEEYILKRREYFDVVTSRAVSQISILAELSLPFVKMGGSFIAYKGELDNNIENGKYAIEVLGGEVEGILEAVLPIEDAKRTFLIVNKKSKTNEKYPRLFDKIAKKPLQKNR